MTITTAHTTCLPENQGCGNAIAKGDVCFYTSHYIKHVNCLQSSMQQIAKTNLFCTYVAMDAPQNGKIELRKATPRDIRKHNKINPTRGCSTAKSADDSGFFSPNADTPLSSRSRTNSFTSIKDAQLVDEAFEPKTQTTSAQASSQLTNSSSITDIIEKVTQLTLSFIDEESPPIMTEAEKVNTAIANYLEETNAKPTKKDFILVRVIELPAREKILALAEEKSQEPYNDLLYLIHLVAHPETPKASIEVIQKALITSQANLEISLSNYADSHEEGLQELRTHLDELISIRLAAQ